MHAKESSDVYRISIAVNRSAFLCFGDGYRVSRAIVSHLNLEGNSNHCARACSGMLLPPGARVSPAEWYA